MSSKSARHPEASSRQVVWPLCLLALAALLPATSASPVAAPHLEDEEDYSDCSQPDLVQGAAANQQYIYGVPNQYYDYEAHGAAYGDYGQGSFAAYGGGTLGGGAWGHVDPSGRTSESHSWGFGR